VINYNIINFSVDLIRIFVDYKVLFSFHCLRSWECRPRGSAEGAQWCHKQRSVKNQYKEKCRRARGSRNSYCARNPLFCVPNL